MKLDSLPAAHIIRGFRGVLDFYVDHGQPVVRRWPQNKHAGSTPGGNYNRRLFARAQHNAVLSAPNVVAALRAAVGGTKWTWKDYYTSPVLGGSRNAPKRPPYPAIDLPGPNPDPGQWQVPPFFIVGTSSGWSDKPPGSSPPNPGPVFYFLHIISPLRVPLQLFWFGDPAEAFVPTRTTRGITEPCGIDYLPHGPLHTAAMTTTTWGSTGLWQNYVWSQFHPDLPVGFFFFFCPRTTYSGLFTKSLSPTFYYDPRFHWVAKFDPPDHTLYRANPLSHYGMTTSWDYRANFGGWLPRDGYFDPYLDTGADPSPLPP